MTITITIHHPGSLEDSGDYLREVLDEIQHGAIDGHHSRDFSWDSDWDGEQPEPDPDLWRKQQAEDAIGVFYD